MGITFSFMHFLLWAAVVEWLAHRAPMAVDRYSSQHSGGIERFKLEKYYSSVLDERWRFLILRKQIVQLCGLTVATLMNDTYSK